MTAQELQALDATSWLTVPQSGTVDLGLSPVLSYESQSSHTLNSFSEPEKSTLPPGLDLSFAADPSWDTPAPMAYASAHAMTPHHPGYSLPFLHAPSAQGSHTGLEYGPVNLHGAAPGVPQFGHCFHGAHPGYPERTASYPALIPQRRLLPRTEGSVDTNQPIYGPQRTLRPMSASRGSLSSMNSVSTMTGQQYGVDVPVHPHSQVAVYPQPTPAHVSTQAPVAGLSAPQDPSHGRPFSQGLYRPDSDTEDLSAFIRFDHEQHAVPTAPMRSDSFVHREYDLRTDGVNSYPGGYVPGSATVSNASLGELGFYPTKVEQAAAHPVTSATTPSLPSENDEGRYRNHPLYSEGPRADGLYHCPFGKDDPSCHHEPTKLKCNYECVSMLRFATSFDSPVH